MAGGEHGGEGAAAAAAAVPVTPQSDDAADRERVAGSLARYAILGAGVETCEVSDGVAWFRIAAHNIELRWSFWARFSDIERLLHQPMARDWEQHLTLRCRLPGFPEKRSKLLVDHTSVHFVRQRTVLLRHFLAGILRDAALSALPAVNAFFTPGAHAHHLILANTTAADLEESRETHCLGSPRGEGAGGAAPSAYAAQLADECAAALGPVWRGEGRRAPGGGAVPEPAEITAVRVPSAQVLNEDHVIYQVELANSLKQSSFSSWVVLKRFSEFVRLRDELASELSAVCADTDDLLPPLPRRRAKVVVDHLEHSFIESRRILVQDWLQTVIALPYVRTMPCVLSFLGV